MKVSVEWLSDYVDVPENVEEILTDIGLNVDEIYEPEIKGPIYTGKVIKVSKHPNAEKLIICEVDIGFKKVAVITGDLTVKEGDFVVVALPGAVLTNGNVIKEVTMRGVKSEGMLCSLEELGIEEKSDRVFRFEREVELGLDVVNLFKLNDKILEVEITPNRGDALSYIGIARDLSTKIKCDLKIPDVEIVSDGKKTEDFVEIEIEDVEGCPRYSAMVLRGVKVSESPVWLKRRLMASGIRPINNIVDATNYVMLETGHPIHAFDYHLITSKKIVVRKARKGEKEILLDEKEYEFSGLETLITDGGERIIAVGGVMGAQNSGVNDDTRDVLIEVAFFDPVRIRRTAKNLKIQSDASYRFERGVDPNDVEYVMKRVVSLIQKLAGGIATENILDVYPKKIEKIDVTLRKKKIEDVLGIKVPDEDVMDILKRLGFEVKDGVEFFQVKVPTHRIYDVQREIDLIEEIGRIYGYDKIGSTKTTLWSDLGGLNDRIKFRRQLIEMMKALGYDEVFTFSFTSSEKVKSIKLNEDVILSVQNPITDELDIMRPSLFYTLLDVAQYNFTHQIRSLKIFEIGKIFSKENKPEEKWTLSAMAYGMENEEDYTDRRKVNFYTFKGGVDEIFDRLGIRAVYEPAEISGFVPTRTAEILVNEDNVGFIGMVDPDLSKKYDIKTDVYYFELDLEKLYKYNKDILEYHPSPLYPSIKRDIALLIYENTRSSDVINKIYEAGGSLVEDVKIIDVFRGEGVPEDATSVTFSITFRSNERTLSDEEVNTLFEKILEKLEKDVGVKRRF